MSRLHYFYEEVEGDKRQFKYCCSNCGYEVRHAVGLVGPLDGLCKGRGKPVKFMCPKEL
jgi:hypothetical protein